MAGPAPGHGGVTGLTPNPDAARNWPPVVGRIPGRLIRPARGKVPGKYVTLAAGQTGGRVPGRRDRIPAGPGGMNQENLLSVLVKDRLHRSLPGTRAPGFRGRRQADPASEGDVP
jgi:hypothetical protein